MVQDDFEGTVVLERLAEIGRLDEFFEMVDADDVTRAAALLRAANLDPETIRTVLEKMRQSDEP